LVKAALCGLAIAGVVATIVIILFLRESRGPKAQAIATLDRLVGLLAESNAGIPPDLVVAPQSIRDLPAAARDQWLRDVLRDEVSAEGLRALAKNGRFGPLPELFPDEAAAWAGAAGVQSADCVAFRMEHGEVTAEVVLAHTRDGLRIVRCNNVKQMALASNPDPDS